VKGSELRKAQQEIAWCSPWAGPFEAAKKSGAGTKVRRVRAKTPS
jgi:hypothetical protein